MSSTSPFADKLADIQAHLMSGGKVQVVTRTGHLFTYDRRHVGWFVATPTGLDIGFGGAQCQLGTATITLK